MPQAPLPAPAARIGTAPIFTPLNPGTYMSREPFNVLKSMVYPDMIEHAMNGVKLASQIAALPREAQDTALQVAQGSILKEHANAIKKRMDEILKAKVGPNELYKTEDERMAAYNRLLAYSGLTNTPQGTSSDTLGAALKIGGPAALTTPPAPSKPPPTPNTEDTTKPDTTTTPTSQLPAWLNVPNPAAAIPQPTVQPNQQQNRVPAKPPDKIPETPKDTEGRNSPFFLGSLAQPTAAYANAGFSPLLPSQTGPYAAPAAFTPISPAAYQSNPFYRNQLAYA